MRQTDIDLAEIYLIPTHKLKKKVEKDFAVMM